MDRRKFIQGLGFGGVLGAVTAPAHAHVAATTKEEKRDLSWARKRVEEGHRVRLEKWASEERPEMKGDEGVMTVRQGNPAGIVELDELVVTVEVLEGPWEIVPEEDYPKPTATSEPEGYVPGDLWIGEPIRGDMWGRAPQITFRGREGKW